MSDENERSVASDGSVAGDRDIIARLRDWRSVHLARLHEVMEQAADEIELLRGYRDEAESEASIASLAVERLRLTDAERYAIIAGLRCLERQLWADPENLGGDYRDMQRDAATLRGLLDRLK